MVSRAKMNRGRLLGVVIGYSSQRVRTCQRLQLSWRLWILKMILRHLVPNIVRMCHAAGVVW